MQIDFKEIPPSGEQWEFFTRDFLMEVGLALHSPPDRGADGGKDMLFTEQLEGKFGTSSFRWLVSCKHNAQSGKAVSADDEPNILERVQSFGADGFLGCYSTIAASSLNTRLRDLRDRGKLRDYRLFDARLIENYLLQLGFSKLVMRYMPKAYSRIKPLHAIVGQYHPLNCVVCGQDLLEAMYTEHYKAIVVLGRRYEGADYLSHTVEEMAWVCKGKCDEKISQRYQAKDLSDGWEDISDLVIPVKYLQWIITSMNRMREGKLKFSDDAYAKHKHLIICLGQKVLREMTAAEKDRFSELEDIP